MTLGVTSAAFRATAAKLNASCGKTTESFQMVALLDTLSLNPMRSRWLVCGCLSVKYSRSSDGDTFIAEVLGCNGGRGNLAKEYFHEQ